MSDFNDIARRNPAESIAVIKSFGYKITDTSNLGRSLSELVANEGEPALIKVMSIHPDKDLILELFGTKEEPKKSSCACGGGCSGCGSKKHDSFMNASGNFANEQKDPKENTNILAHQTNAILIVSALFIATALIIKNK